MTTQDNSSGVAPRLGADDLVAAVPELATSGIQLRAHTFRSVPGASLSFDDLAALVAFIDSEIRAGADGVVITQGTDTIEETAFFLDLTVASTAPVVVTGAMRNPTLPGADGPANLVAAVRLAASRPARDLGCVVVFSDEIHAARHVRKSHSTSTSAFVSPNTGPLGHIVEGQPRLLARSPRPPIIPLTSQVSGIRVPVLSVVLGDDGEVLRLLSDYMDGLVVAGFGVGHVPSTLVDPLEKLADRVPVVLASRTGAGPVLRGTYGFPGSESDLQARGLINAGFLDPLKARILLQLLLAAGTNKHKIPNAFDRLNGYGEQSRGKLAYEATN